MNTLPAILARAGALLAALAILVAQATGSPATEANTTPTSPTPTYLEWQVKPGVREEENIAITSGWHGNAIDYDLRGGSEDCADPAVKCETTDIHATFRGHENTADLPAKFREKDIGSCNGMILRIYNSDETKTVADVIYTHLIPDTSLYGVETTLSTLQRTPVNVGYLNMPHPDNPAFLERKYGADRPLPFGHPDRVRYRNIKAARPDLTDVDTCPTTGAHLHQVVQTLKPHHSPLPQIPTIHIERAAGLASGDCVSREPWFAKIGGATPLVIVNAPPNAFCPPSALELTKQDYFTLRLSFTPFEGKTSEVQFFAASTREGLCHPADKPCTPSTTRTVAARQTSTTFSNLTPEYWYQARAASCDGSSCGSWSGMTEPFQLVEPGLIPPKNVDLEVETGNRLDFSYTPRNETNHVEYEMYRCGTGNKCPDRVLVDDGWTAQSSISLDPQDGGASYAARARACIVPAPELPAGQRALRSETPPPTGSICGQWSELSPVVEVTGHALIKEVVGGGTFTALPAATNNVYTVAGQAVRLTASGTDTTPWYWSFARWDITDAAGTLIGTSNAPVWSVSMHGVRHVTATFHLQCSASGQQRQNVCVPDDRPDPPASTPEFPKNIPTNLREFTFIQNAASTDVAVQHAIGGNEPVAYTLSGKPAGLSLDYDADGNPPLKLTGTATALQSKTKHTLTATDADGETDTLDVYITVVAPRPKVAQDLTGFAYTPAAMTYGAPDPVLTAPSGAVGTLTYEVTPASESVCTVVETTGALTIDTAGTCTVTALAAATTTHLAGTATAAVEVEKATPDLAFSYDPDDPKVDDPNPTLEPPADSHLDLEYSATPESVCTVNSTTGALTIEGAGECTITVSFDGSNTHEAGSDEAEVVVSKHTPNLAFSYSPSTIDYGDDAPALRPPAPQAGRGALKYSTTTTEVCDIDDGSTGELDIVGGGTCRVKLESAATRTHEAGHDDTIVVVRRLVPVLDFSYSPNELTYGEPTPTLRPPVVPSGVGALKYSSITPDVCRVNGTTGALTIRTGGECEVEVTSARTSKYEAGSARATVDVEKADQLLSNFSYSPPSVEIDATASPVGPAGAVGALTFSATSECSVDASGVVTGVSVGTCVVTVIAATTDTHKAGSTTATVTVTKPAKVDQVLTNFSYTPSEVALDGSVTLNEPEGAVGALSYEVANTAVCTVGPTTGALTLVSAGTCNVTATAAETDTHLEGTANASVRIGYSLTLSATPNTSGWLVPSPRKTVYDDGDTVELTANTISNAWVVSGWGGDCSSRTAKDATCTLTMDDHKSASITLEADESPAFALTEKRYHTIVGKQVSQLLPGATGGNGDLTYSLSGDLPPGMSFSSSTRRVTGAATSSAAGNAYWSTLTVEDCDGDTDTLRIRIYIKNLYDLTILISPRDTGTATGAGRHNEDDEVAISADPEDGYAFENWTGTGIDDTDDSSTTVLMDADKVITANFLNICDNNPGFPGCGARSELDVPTVTIETAGQTVTGGTQVSLAATATGKKLSYAWAGTGTFSDPTAEDPTWTAPAGRSSDQTYTLTLTVATGDGATATATVDIVVSADTDADHDDGDAMDEEESE